MCVEIIPSNQGHFLATFLNCLSVFAFPLLYIKSTQNTLRLIYSYTHFITLVQIYCRNWLYSMARHMGRGFCNLSHDVSIQDLLKSGRLLRKPTTKTSCSSSSRIKACTSISRWHQIWRRAVTLMCLPWLLTTHKVRRSAACCLDPARCPIMGLWEGTAASKIYSMLSFPLEEVSKLTADREC